MKTSICLLLLSSVVCVSAKAPWFDAYRASMGKKFKKCKDIPASVMPKTGDACLKKKFTPYLCGFGDMTCAGTLHPARICTCNGNTFTCAPNPVAGCEAPVTGAPKIAPTIAPTAAPTPIPTVAQTGKPTLAPVPAPTGTTPPTQCFKPANILYKDSFKDDTTKELKNWANSKITWSTKFGFFLGNYYGRGEPSPSITFKVPKKIDALLVHFDFYQIDGWSAAAGDSFWIDVNGVKVDLGLFDTEFSEINRGSFVPTPTGENIAWALQTQGGAQHIGFDPLFKDEKHRVRMQLPGSLYKDRQLTITFHFNLNGLPLKQSGGIDRFRLIEMDKC